MPQSSPTRELDAQQTADYWNNINRGQMHQVGWYAIRYLDASVMRDAFGGETQVQFTHRLLKERNQGQERAYLGAALLCGAMVSERPFFETRNILQFDSVDGFDISPASIAQYQPQGFAFQRHIVDCNDVVLERERYDMIVLMHGAHHVYNLGNLFYQCNKALKPQGLLAMYEWIGPDYLQIPLTNHLVSTMFLYGMFSRKVRTTHMGKVKGRWIQYTPNEFEPSEACNSTELLPQFEHYFTPLRLYQFGGLIYPIFEGIGHRFNQQHRLTQLKIKSIYQTERVLTKLGLIKPLFAIAVAEKRLEL